MAEMQLSHSGNKRRKISTPRVDLTPMVDLGFLLITFFMYTTTLAQPKVLELQRPPENEIHAAKIPGEATLILIPAAKHQTGFYNGLQQPGESLAWCGVTGSDGLRALLEHEQIRVRGLPAAFSKEAHKLHVLIRPDTSAAYDDIVRILDELAIADVPYYTMMRITPVEQAAIQKSDRGVYGK